ncbi:FG-GAP repeat protein [Streptomyces malaysiensis]|uniref:FG-GAP repeat protein n=1 Tax=Streptomyces malaysiensis TaxID=92644 RepID=UPI003716AD5C
MANSWNTDNAGVTALAAGDFNGDGHDDLALGEWVSRTSRSDPFGENASLGAVWLFRRSSPGRAAGWPRCGWRPWGCPSRRRCRSR